jgi:hypothetical protein
MPLAVLFALNVPHAPAAVLPQAADQLTPLVSFVIVAVKDNVPPTVREVGVVVGTVVKETDGVVVPLPPPPDLLELPPHATSAAIMLRLIRRRSDLQNVVVRNVIGHLR